jgi:hypothetical protein
VKSPSKKKKLGGGLPYKKNGRERNEKWLNDRLISNEYWTHFHLNYFCFLNYSTINSEQLIPTPETWGAILDWHWVWHCERGTWRSLCTFRQIRTARVDVDIVFGNLISAYQNFAWVFRVTINNLFLPKFVLLYFFVIQGK